MSLEKKKENKDRDLLFRSSGIILAILGLLMLVAPVAPSDFSLVRILGVGIIVVSYFAIKARAISIIPVFGIGVFFLHYLFGSYSTNSILHFWWGKCLIGCVGVLMVFSSIRMAISVYLKKRKRDKRRR